MIKILPIQHPPLIGFLHHAYPLSILARSESYKPWFYTHYIQLMCNKNISCEDSFSIDFYSESDFLYNLPFLKVSNIPTSILKGMNINILKFIIEGVDNGYYSLPSER